MSAPTNGDRINMSYIDFSDKLSVKVSLIDEQHKILINIINDLHDAMVDGHGTMVINDVLLRLNDYTKMHFSTEERLMAQYNYPDHLAHESQHIDLIAQIDQLNVKVGDYKMPITMETMNFLLNWLFHHILETDKKFGAFLVEKGVK
jgi:hemerythrin